MSFVLGKILTVAALALSLAGTGCPSVQRAPEPDPTDALRAYHTALVEGRPAEAWSWLHPDATRSMDRSAFVDLYTRDRQPLITRSQALMDAASKNAAVETARVQTDRGIIVVVRTADGWRVSDWLPGAIKSTPQ